MKNGVSPHLDRRIAATLAMLCLAAVAAGCGGGGSTPAFTVTATASVGGTISPQSVEVKRGNRATFAVTPSQGYLIEGVTGCGGSLAGTSFTTAPISGDCQVRATFRRPVVSGTVIPAGGTAVDSDVNDPFAPFAPNDDLPEAQLIPNPVTLGGYANEPGAGPEGRSHVDGDEFDVFRVGLLGGQVVTLLIASEAAADDLDLYLVDLDGQIVDASVSDAARVESIVVPEGASGEFFLAVHAFSGASNYLLNIGQAVSDLAPATRLSDAFVPGELIVRLADHRGKEDGVLDGLGILGAGRERGHEGAPRNLLVTLDELSTQGERIAGARRGIEVLRGAAGPLGMPSARDGAMAAKLETLLTAKSLARDPAIAAAAPNYLHELHSTFNPNDPHFRLQWHYPQISLPQAWPLSAGAGVIVAVIDSGVFLAHPDLAGRVVEGYDFIAGTPGGNDPGDSPIPPSGSSFHGTHVAGTIAAATDNGIGVAGTAFGARVMPLRVCTTSGCPSFAIEQALRFAAGLPNDSGTVPAQTASVINLSLGRQGPAVASEQSLYDELRALDIVVVSSAGNSNTSERSYPAAYQNVLAVSAVDIEARKAFYSNFGSWIDLAAPGGDLRRDLNADGFPDGVLSTIADDRDGQPLPRYTFLQGTSMAAPHVAGVVALMRSAVPALGAQDIEGLLRNGLITDDLGAPGRDDIFGHGLINAARAVTEALSTGGAPVELEPFMSASPPSVNFGTGLATVTVVFANSGGGELEFGAHSEDSGGWLGVASEHAEDSLILTLSAQRAGLAEGVYSATVTVTSSANSVGVPVFMQVAEILAAGVGLQFVLLIDPETFDTLNGAIAVPAPDGSQTFRVEDVAPGTYLLVSGSDSDNDDFICDAGESCGIYRGPGDVVLIEVEGADIGGLEFTAGYGLSAAESQSLPSSPRHGLPLQRADRSGEDWPRLGR